jgi:hypothetical protein
VALASTQEIGVAANAAPALAGSAASRDLAIPTSGTDLGEEVRYAVTVSVPLVAILGAAVWIACRYMGLRTWHAALALLFGFFLAATSAAPEIRRLVSVVISAANTH